MAADKSVGVAIGLFGRSKCDRDAAELGAIHVEDRHGTRIEFSAICRAFDSASSDRSRRDYGIVCDLAVTARCRGAGIGEKLYRAAEAWFAQRQIHRIEVRVAVSNETSTSFWKKMGCVPYVTTVVKNI